MIWHFGCIFIYSYPSLSHPNALAYGGSVNLSWAFCSGRIVVLGLVGVSWVWNVESPIHFIAYTLFMLMTADSTCILWRDRIFCMYHVKYILYMDIWGRGGFFPSSALTSLCYTYIMYFFSGFCKKPVAANVWRMGWGLAYCFLKSHLHTFTFYFSSA